MSLRRKLPPLTSLAAFEAVCRLNSFTKAAHELNLTQAAISRQIIKLEEDLGVTLFERRSHDVGLTQDGERYARTINPAINAIGDATQIMKSNKAEADQLVIFSETCMAAYRIVPRMPRFQALFPHVSIKLLTSNEAMEDVIDPFDIGFQYGPADKRLFISKSTWSDNIIVVCSPDFRDTLPEKCRIQDMQEASLIHTQKSGSGWMSWVDFFERFDATLIENKASLTFSTYNSAIDAAISGSGLVLGWRFLVNREIEEGRLVQVGDFSVPSPDNFHAYSKKNGSKPELVEKYIQWFEKELEPTVWHCQTNLTGKRLILNSG